MPNKSSNPDATMMIVVDEKDPSTDPKTYQYVYVGNINDLPSDVLTESSIVNDLSTGGTDKPLSAEQGRTLNSHVNYTTCGSNAGDQVKLISDDGFELSTHLRLLVMMTNTNTNSTPKFNINNTGVKDVWYNGSIASDTNTWSAGEVLDIYYDGNKYVATPYLNVDDVPTAGSNNLVKSGGVQNELALGAVYDVSAKNSTAGPNNDGKWESLFALLSDANLNTLIPTSVRKGGMSIKFVQSSDNKYVQYRYMKTDATTAATFTNINNWELSDNSESNLFLYIKQADNTNFSLLKKAIKKIYWKQIPTERGHYLTSFGYYAPSNWFYGQLKKADGTIISTKSYDFDTFDGIFEISDLVIIVNKDLFTHQYFVYLSDNCYLPEIAQQAVTTDKIANGAVTTDKIANGAVTTDKIANGAIIANKIPLQSINNIKLVSSFITLGGNIIEQATRHQNHYIGTSGTESPEYSDWNYYELDVVPDAIYEATSTAGQVARLWLVLNSSAQVVALSSDASTIGYKTETIVIPPNGAKLIINSRQKPSSTDVVPPILKQGSCKISAGEVYYGAKSIVQYVNDLVNTHNDNILFGKTLVCCGDSITYGADMDAEGIVERTIEMYEQGSNGVVTSVTSSTVRASYGYQIAARNGMIFCNAGVSGSTMQGLSNKAGFSLVNGRYTTLPNNIDYLTIWFGWNDTAYGSLGTINDNTNESYYGGYNVVMPYLINKYPYTKIALIVPFGTDEGHRNAIRLLANKWGVACFDFYGPGTPLYYGKENSVGVNADIVTANRAKFQANGAHPNFKGHRQLSNMLEKFLQGI